jgi:type III restriction enzyme
MGNRMDAEACGDAVHDVNVLTVIANESYKDFVSALQTDIKEMLYDRPLAATSEYFKGKCVKKDGVQIEIDIKTGQQLAPARRCRCQYYAVSF